MAPVAVLDWYNFDFFRHAKLARRMCQRYVHYLSASSTCLYELHRALRLISTANTIGCVCRVLISTRITELYYVSFVGCVRFYLHLCFAYCSNRTLTIIRCRKYNVI